MSSTNYIEKVAIIGATGRVGAHFLEELLKTKRHSITAITRHDSTATFPGSVNIARVDYTNPATLVSALRDQQFLIITLSVRAPPGIHTTIVKAAAEAGVPYIMPNCYGGDFNNETLRNADVGAAGAYKNATEVAEAGVSYIAMCCGFWYEWSLATGEQWFGFDIKNRTVTFFEDGKTRINTSTWRQCGKALAALLSLPAEKGTGAEGAPAVDQWKNDRFFVSSFSISQRDMLDSLHRVLGTEDADWEIKYESYAKRIRDGNEELQQGDMRGFAKRMYAKNFSIAGGMNFGDKVVSGVLELPEEDLDEATKRAVDMVESGWNPFASIDRAIKG